MGFGCFGLFEKQGKKGGNASDAKIDYPRVEKPQKDPQERIDQSVEDITLQTALNDLENQKEQPVSKDSGIGELNVYMLPQNSPNQEFSPVRRLPPSVTFVNIMVRRSDSSMRLTVHPPELLNPSTLRPVRRGLTQTAM